MPTAAYYRAHRERLAAQERLRYQAGRGYVSRTDLRAKDHDTGRFVAAEFDPAAVERRLPGTSLRRRRPRAGNYEPIPAVDSHPLVDAAIAALRSYERAELEPPSKWLRSWRYPMDSIARDLIGEYVLAAVEGRDPLAAMNSERSRRAHDRANLVHGLSLVDDLDR